jgi:hypothetical protein
VRLVVTLAQALVLLVELVAMEQAHIHLGVQ